MKSHLLPSEDSCVEMQRFASGARKLGSLWLCVSCAGNHDRLLCLTWEPGFTPLFAQRGSQKFSSQGDWGLNETMWLYFLTRFWFLPFSSFLSSLPGPPPRLPYTYCPPPTRSGLSTLQSEGVFVRWIWSCYFSLLYLKPFCGSLLLEDKIHPF